MAIPPIVLKIYENLLKVGTYCENIFITFIDSLLVCIYCMVMIGTYWFHLHLRCHLFARKYCRFLCKFVLQILHIFPKS